MKNKIKRFLTSIFLSKRGWGWLISLLSKSIFLYVLFKDLKTVNLYTVILYGIMEISYLVITKYLKVNDINIDVDVDYGK